MVCDPARQSELRAKHTDRGRPKRHKRGRAGSETTTGQLYRAK